VRPVWIGIDTGGTFTDLVLVDLRSGRYACHKLPTTPGDASIGILQGIEEILATCDMQASSVGFLAHGTTLATNAALERKWAKTGMLTTAGFRDLLELARQRRPDFFNLDVPKPMPPASRDLRIEVEERIAADGSVIVPLVEEDIARGIERLREAGCEALAICFLHAYANPAHERRAEALVRERWPEAHVCTSSSLLAEFREFERFATATVNASLIPVIDRYLDRFEAGVAELGVEVEPRIMQSNGGAVSPAAIRRAPVNTFFSGPAGGVIGAAGLCTSVGVADLITFDMGGTSTDVCLVREGMPARKTVRAIGGFPVRTRTLDLHTIGAGGGSIAWIDPGGLLKVGPMSAGAEPGPAAYDRGGVAPTVTDANIVLGRLNQQALLAGRMPIRPDLARGAIERELGQRLGMDPIQVAAGILEIINANMMGAVRVISVEQGEDPRDFTLVAFGGAGPLHAADVAAAMGIPRVLVPSRPGLLSALGLLHADTRGDFSLTCLALAEPASLAALGAAFEELSSRAMAWLAREDIDARARVEEWQIEMRYVGQNFELLVDLGPDGALDARGLADLVASFERQHEAAYGYALEGHPVEIVNIRMGLTLARPAPPAEPGAGAGRRPEEALMEVRDVWFPGTGFVQTPVYDRDRLPVRGLEGPAIIEQMDSTTVVPPGAHVHPDRFGNLLIEVAPSNASRDTSPWAKASTP
jgi:N-methylhydantoinase A